MTYISISVRSMQTLRAAELIPYIYPSNSSCHKPTTHILYKHKYTHLHTDEVGHSESGTSLLITMTPPDSFSSRCP